MTRSADGGAHCFLCALQVIAASPAGTFLLVPFFLSVSGCWKGSFHVVNCKSPRVDGVELRRKRSVVIEFTCEQVRSQRRVPPIPVDALRQLATHLGSLDGASGFLQRYSRLHAIDRD